MRRGLGQAQWAVKEFGVYSESYEELLKDFNERD